MAAPIQNSRFEQLLSRLFGNKQSVGLQIVEDVLPVADLHDVQAPESYRPRGEHLWMQSVSGTAGAANQARVQIGFDPATPDSLRNRFITIVDELHIFSAVAPPCSVDFGLTPGLNLTATGVTVRYRDARSIPTNNYGVSPFGVTQILFDGPALATANTTLGQLRLDVANVERVIRPGIVILPFSKLEISINVVNAVLGVLALGRERPIDQPGEAA